MHRLAIITTHPIQYNAPFFRILAQSDKVALKVFYTWDKGSGQKHDPGFGQQISWDIPLLEGYEYTFAKNTAKDPGSHHFGGIKNPTLVDEIKNYQPNAILVYGWSFRSHLQVMRYFKGKIPVWFRGDSTLLDYEYRSLKEVFRNRKKTEVGSRKPEDRSRKSKGVRVMADDKKTAIKNHWTIVHCSLFINQLLIPFLSFFKFSIRRIFLTWVYRHIDKAFYVGTNNKNYYIKHGVKESQLVWMPHAVDNAFFQKNEVKDEIKAKEWRQKLGIRDDDFTLLFAGKFIRKKNPELLIKAVIEMNENNCYNNSTAQFSNPINKSSAQLIHFIMVGSGPLELNLKQIATGKDYIHFLPFQNQMKMPIVYRLGNIFCLSSQSETWGLAVNEAMACARTVIVSDKTGCAADLIINNQTGFIFRHHSIDDLKQAIIKSTHLKSPNQHAKHHIQNWNYNPQPLVSQLNFT